MPEPNSSPASSGTRGADAAAQRRDDHSTVYAVGRRGLLRTSVLGATVAVLGSQAGCASATPDVPRSTPGNPGPAAPSADTGPSSPPAGGSGPSVLVAYFSRPGENYHYGGRRDLSVGNTEVLARIIAQQVPCDVHRIEAAEPYARSYDDTVARNVREQDADARPGIANPLASVRDYDVVLLGSPIWNVRPPMIMRTFAESLDLTGTTVHPFTTHAMSGLGTTEREYASACRGAIIGEGLAVKGEEVAEAARAVTAWLGRINLQGGTRR